MSICWRQIASDYWSLDVGTDYLRVSVQQEGWAAWYYTIEAYLPDWRKLSRALVPAAHFRGGPYRTVHDAQAEAYAQAKGWLRMTLEQLGGEE